MSVSKYLWRKVSNDPRFLGCTSKRQYAARAEAQVAADRIVADRGGIARTYRCPFARHFHVSTHPARPGRVS